MLRGGAAKRRAFDRRRPLGEGIVERHESRRRGSGWARGAGAALAAALAWGAPAAAHPHEWTGADSTADSAAAGAAHEGMDHAGHDMSAMEGASAVMDHAAHGMAALFGPYGASREASGTSWQPEAVPHRGLHRMAGPWSQMTHGFVTGIYDDQGGPRGDHQTISTSMLMSVASRDWGPGRVGLRTMLSAEPWTVGDSGYPLLLQSGETGDGVTPLRDRQHPHDLLMEMAASFSVSKGAGSAFAYLGYPGEPALGPPVFMHRFSGEDIPDSPITHHWLDSTHITWGVATVGATSAGFKIETSRFTGREPDQRRTAWEQARWDSWSVRASANPSPEWAFQWSHGHLVSPEQLEPQVDQDRTTASAMYARDLGAGVFASTLAWGRNVNTPGNTLDAWLLESSLAWGGHHTAFARGEWVEKDELVPEGEPLGGNVIAVGRVQGGYLYDFHPMAHVAVGVGAEGTINFIAPALRDAYDGTPFGWMAILRARLI